MKSNVLLCAKSVKVACSLSMLWLFVVVVVCFWKGGCFGGFWCGLLLSFFLLFFLQAKFHNTVMCLGNRRCGVRE